MNTESDVMDAVKNHSCIQLDADGDDYRPAPLQNDYIADGTFDGVINMANWNNACGSSAEMAE